MISRTLSSTFQYVAPNPDNLQVFDLQPQLSTLFSQLVDRENRMRRYITRPDENTHEKAPAKRSSVVRDEPARPAKQTKKISTDCQLTSKPTAPSKVYAPPKPLSSGSSELLLDDLVLSDSDDNCDVLAKELELRLNAPPTEQPVDPRPTAAQRKKIYERTNKNGKELKNGRVLEVIPAQPLQKYQR